jgi:MurNAc alpha-1-phosphate uridylyltransferase
MTQPSSPALPATAMILAAGLGTRMMPLTHHQPKAMVPILGRPMIDGILDHLAAMQVQKIVVNVHYQRDPLIHHLKNHALNHRIVILEEDERLETGGGIVNALSHLGPLPFFCINCDSLWLDGPTPALTRLARGFHPNIMDALLLLYPTVKLPAEHTAGDFFMTPSGQLRRRARPHIAPYLYTGIQILHPRLLAGQDKRPFSLNVVYNQALSQGRLFGQNHDGLWYHVSTPDDVTKTEDALGVLGLAR